MNRNGIVQREAPAVLTATGGATMSEVERIRAELQHERTCRRRAEADAAASEERAIMAEWMVSIMRSELVVGEKQHWWWPWRRQWRL